MSEFSIIAINVRNLTISKLSFSGGRIHFGHGSLPTVEQNDGVVVLSTAHLTTQCKPSNFDVDLEDSDEQCTCMYTACSSG